MSLTAPKDKQRASARVNWLLRQLAKSEAAGIQVRANWPGRAAATQASLEALRANPECIEADRALNLVNTFAYHLTQGHVACAQVRA